jgi:hypothetical protein
VSRSPGISLPTCFNRPTSLETVYTSRSLLRKTVSSIVCYTPWQTSHLGSTCTYFVQSASKMPIVEDGKRSLPDIPTSDRNSTRAPPHLGHYQLSQGQSLPILCTLQMVYRTVIDEVVSLLARGFCRSFFPADVAVGRTPPYQSRCYTTSMAGFKIHPAILPLVYSTGPIHSIRHYRPFHLGIAPS